MKLPKKVLIAGKEWDVIQDKNMRGGQFDCCKAMMKIGTKYPKEIGDVFLHEVIEAILLERNCRYSLFGKYENDGYIFVLNHKEFDNLCRDIVFALKDVLK